MNTCYLCGKNGCTDALEKHHIFGGALRKKSEKYNLTVQLCGDNCHRNGKNSVHKNTNTRKEIQAYGQRKAMLEQGWSVEEFRREFGGNYLNSIAVLNVEPGIVPSVAEIVNDEEFIKREIEHDFEMIRINKDTCMIYNPEALELDLEPNFTFRGKLVYGKVLFVGIKNNTLCSINDETAQKYAAKLCEVVHG